MAVTGAQEFKNYIGGEWVDAASGETFESRRARPRASRSAPSRARARRTSTAPSRPRRTRSRSGGSCPRPSAARSSSASRSSSSDDKQELTELMTREMGKVLAEAGGDVQEAIDMSDLHGGRGAPPVRPHDALRAARQVPDVGAHAHRRRRRDHAVELPDRDPRLEARAGARLRQHGRLQAGRGHAAARRALRRAPRRGRAARPGSSTSCTAPARRRATGSCATPTCR